MKKIWQADWSCNQKEIFMMPLLMAALGTMGVLVVLFALFLGDAEDYVLMGTLMALIAGFLITPALCAANYSNWWRLSGSMGATRKEFFFYMLLRQLGSMMVSYAVLLVLWQTELRLYSHLFPELPNLTDLTDLIRLPVAAGIIGAAVTIHLLLGSLAVQFGTMGIGIPQGIIVGSFWIITIFDQVRAKLFALPEQIWQMLFLAALAASAVTIFVITRKMMVK